MYQYYNSIMKTRNESTHSLREQEQTALKDKHRQEILEAGKKLCLDQGVADVDMKEIAAAAHVSRATLYRYFPSKKLLVYEILRRLAGEAAFECEAESRSFSGNGYEKFSRFIAQIVSTHYRFPILYRFMGMVDFYYGAQDSPDELVQLYHEVFQGLLVGDTPHLYLEEGQRDGSVRRDIDPRTCSASMLAALVSLNEQVAATREATRAIYGVDNPDQLIETLAQALLRGIR